MRKILIAVGGSGGHLVPAQAFAEELLQEGDVEILFAGAHLSTNRYFNRNKYAYQDIKSATPFASFSKKIKSLFSIALGVKESFTFLARFSPDLVVGFGSFHAFPLLLAALLKKIPLILFESNSIPGKVTRVFSRFAKVTALYFPQAEKFLKGKTTVVAMPVRYEIEKIKATKAREYFGLKGEERTLLVFGGSQGASALNQFVQGAVSHLKPVQIIHCVGKEEWVAPIQKAYEQEGILAYVTAFEKRMDYAYLASTCAITRSGAVTLSELIAFQVPALLVPYPHAADAHQLKNAKILQDSVGGALYFEEKELRSEQVITKLKNLLEDEHTRSLMQGALLELHQKRNSLMELIKHYAKS